MDMREAFEGLMSEPPYERNLARLGPDSSWPGHYRDYPTQLAWEAFQAGAQHEREQKPVAVLAYRRSGRSGVCGQTLGADGAGAFAVVYFGDEASACEAASARIAEDQRSGHRVREAILASGECYSGPSVHVKHVAIRSKNTDTERSGAESASNWPGLRPMGIEEPKA